MLYAPNKALGNTEAYKRKKAISSSKGRFITGSQSKVRTNNHSSVTSSLFVPDNSLDKMDIPAIIYSKPFQGCCQSGKCFINMFKTADIMTELSNFMVNVRIKFES